MKLLKKASKINRPLDRARQEGKKRLFFLIKLILVVVGLVWRYRFPDSYDQLKLDGRILPTLFFYLTSVLLVSFGRISLVYLYLKRQNKESDFRDNYIVGINRIASILYGVILIISIPYYFNIEVKEFFTSISIVAAAIAIISREYLVNMINGFILMFSNQFSINDYIKVGEDSGRITDITLMNVVLLNDDDEIVYIPNSTMASSHVINSSKKNFKKLSFDFELLPEALPNIDHFESYLIEALKAQFKNINLEKFSLKVDSIKKDAIVIKLHVTLDRRQKDLEKPVRRFINKSILAYASDTKFKKEE